MGYTARETVSVRVVGLRDEFTNADLAAWNPVPVQCVPVRGPRSFGFSEQVSKLLQVAEPDLVHVHGLWQFNSIAVLRWHHRSKRPYLVSPHGMLDPWALRNAGWKKRIAWSLYERAHLGRASCIRALCRSEVQSIRALGLRGPICLIPNGVDLPGSRGTMPTNAESGITELAAGKKVLLYLGRIHPKKGLACLLRAWARVKPPVDWRLVIAGWDQGGHLKELKRLSNELGLAGESHGSPTTAPVRFIGPQFGTAKKAWLQQCEAMILPSMSEGVPMAILEAWAHGKPALITPECHLTEGVQKGAAISIEPDEVGILRGLKTLFEASPAELEHMGRRGREVVVTSFDWSRVAEQLRGVYRWMRHGGPRPDCVLES
jgi:glycosyltransferase involved in cell wall biosynthesis